MCPLQLHASTLNCTTTTPPPPQQVPSREIPIAPCHYIFILKGEWGKAESSDSFELQFLKQSTK